MPTEPTPAPRLQKGQTLYREKSRRGSYNQPREVEPVTVGTVGTKYFTVEQEKHERYLKSTLTGEYNRERLHLSPEEITDEWARQTLQRRLSTLFDYGRLPLDVLRQIDQLVAPFALPR